MDFNEINGNEVSNVLTLEDENGEECVYELLDALEHNGKKYLVCVPQVDMIGAIIVEVSDDVIFLEVNEEMEEIELIAVIDEEYCEELFEIFKERNKEIF